MKIFSNSKLIRYSADGENLLIFRTIANNINDILDKTSIGDILDMKEVKTVSSCIGIYVHQIATFNSFYRVVNKEKSSNGLMYVLQPITLY